MIRQPVRSLEPDVKLGCHPIDLTEALRASDNWGFNCGPAALCAVTGLTPSELYPYLGDFHAKGFMNPTMMRQRLERLGIKYGWDQPNNQGPLQDQAQAMPEFGICRIQFGGPWCKAGVPKAAAYRQTHWIATRLQRFLQSAEQRTVFDCNNDFRGDSIVWAPYENWREVVLPQLVSSYKRADCTWWVTHSVEVQL